MIRKISDKIKYWSKYWSLMMQWENDARKELIEIGLNPDQWFIDDNGDIYFIDDEFMIEKAVTPFKKWLRNKCKN